MKTIVSNTDQEIVYQFTWESDSCLYNYVKDPSADPHPDYSAISNADYNKWLVWLGVLE
jgi:hypothetical protein